MDIDTFRETLINLGITPSILAAIGITSAITLFFSVRIVLQWYLGISQVHDDLRQVERQLADLKLQLSHLRFQKDTDRESGLGHAPEKHGQGPDTFRLNH